MTDKPKMIERADGTRLWYLNGRLHREDGPAIEYSNGSKAWYLNGQLHREDGPAIEHPGGTKSWYLDGNPMPQSLVIFWKLERERRG